VSWTLFKSRVKTQSPGTPRSGQTNWQDLAITGYIMFNTCKLCSEYLYRVCVMLCYTVLCYVMLGCSAVPCPKNVSAQSDPVSFCASDNKRLVSCDVMYSFNIDTLGGARENNQ